MSKQNTQTTTTDDVIVTPKAHWVDAARLAIITETEIDDLNKALNDKRGSIADALLQLGKESKSKLDDFLNNCAITEAWAKSEQCPEADRWDTIPRCWTQAKSNVKAALKHGFKLGAVKTSYELRTALNEKRKQDAKAKGKTSPTVNLGHDAEGNEIDGTIVNEYLQSIMDTVKKLPNQAMVDAVAEKLMGVEFYMLELIAEFDDLTDDVVVDDGETEVKVA